ncbi:MAG: glycosyltransferase [Thermodesulfobacteriota bacterium]
MGIKVLIGIPVLDNLEMNRACLEHLFRYTERDRIDLNVSLLILDNGSREDIPGLLRTDFNTPPFELHYRRNPRNLGVAIAWNQILNFCPNPVPGEEFYYDYYVISNNDALCGPDWLQPMVEAMKEDRRIGWVSAMENGSPVQKELLEAHAISKQYRIDPLKPFTTAEIYRSIEEIYASWGGFEAFCRTIQERHLPRFIPFVKDGRSAVCFMLRPEMVNEIGFFDEEFAPVGIAEDLEYFLRMDGILDPPDPRNRPPYENKRWRSGYCGQSIVHHNWCSTRQGKHFDGRKWDQMREKNWKTKFGRSKKYFTRLFD